MSVLRRRARELLSARGSKGTSPADTTPGLAQLDLLEAAVEVENADLRATQAQLRRSSDHFRELFEHAPTGYVGLDARGTIRVANQTLASLLGRDREELLGAPFAAYIAPASVSAFRDCLPESRGAVEPQRVVLQLLNAGGGGVSAQVTFSARRHLHRREISWELGELIYASVADVTDLIRRGGEAPPERATRPSPQPITPQDASEDRPTSLSLAHADRLATLGVLAAGVAHEINNPLGYLQLNLEELLEKLGSEEVTHRERVREALEGVHRVAVLVKQLAVFSREDDGDLEIVELRGPLQTSLRIAKARLKHEIEVVEDYAPIVSVQASEGLLVQVFLNLILNASHAMEGLAREASRLTLRTRLVQGMVQIEVSDTGPGVPAEHLAQVFETFFTTKPAGQGTGLGLPISRGIIEELGGSLTLESAPGSGTTVRVLLPAASSGGPVAAPPERVSPPSEPSG